MANDERKAQLSFEVDGSGVKSGLNDIKRDVQGMAQDVEKSGKKAAAGINAIGDGAPETSKKVDAATRSIVNSIQRTVAAADAGEKGTAKYYESLARQRNVSTDLLKPYLDDLRRSEAAQKAATVGLGTMEVSAKQTAAALRGVPAQFTDIITSLQGGQAPLTVFLQQGGQLKDMFGGAGNAARALAGYVMGLVNPFTLAAAAAGVLGLAYFQGSKEADAYRKAIVLTGNAAGTTSGDLAGMAKEISNSVGTQGAAAAALAQMVGSGEVARKNLQDFSRVAIEVEKNIGMSIEETVGHFKELGKAPVEASLKLNEQYRYLTASVYDQIRALRDQGKETEAASLAQRTYATAMSERSDQLKGNLGAIERGWRAVTGAAKGAWDAMLNVGRQDTAAQELEKVGKQIEAIRRTQSISGFESNGGGAAFGRGGMESAQRERQLQTLLAQQAVLQKTVDLEKIGAEAQARKVAAEEAGIRFSNVLYEGRTKQQKLEVEIAKVRADGLAAGKSELEIQKAINVLKAQDKFKESGSGAAGVGQTEVAAIKAKVAEQTKYLELLRTQGAEADNLTEGERLVIKIKEELKTSISGVARAEKERALAAAESLATVDRQVAGEKLRIDGLEKSRQAYAALIDEAAKTGQALSTQADELEASNEMWGKGKTAIEEYRLALVKAKLAEVEGGSDSSYDPAYAAALRAQVAAQERKLAATRMADFKALNQQADELLRSASAMADAYAEESNLSGLTAEQRAKIVARRQVELKYAKEIADVDRSSLTEEQKAATRQKLREAERIEVINAENKVMRDEAQRTADDINRSLTDALLRGFESGKGFAENFRDTLKNMINTLVLRPIISATLEPISGAISAAVGNGSSGGGILGMIKDGKSLYDYGTKAYSWLTGAGSASGVTSSLGAAFYTAPALYAGSAALAGGATTALAGGALGSGTALGTGWALGSSAGALGTGTALLGTSGTAAAISAGTAAGATAGAAAGTAAAGGSSAAGAAASLGPYGWVAAAAILSIMAFAGKGEKRYGGQYGINFEGDEVLNGRRGTNVGAPAGSIAFLEGPSGGDYAGDTARKLITGTTQGINTILKDLGSGMALTGFQAGLETSGKGRGGVYSGGTLTGGVTFGESGTGDNYKGTLFERTSSRSPNAEEAVKNFATDMLQVTIQALQAATDVPKVIAAQLKGVDAEKLTDEAAAQLLNSIQAQVDYVKSFRDTLNSLPFANLKDVAFDTAAGLIAAAGGIEALNQNISGYFENYFTEEEQRTAAVARTASAFTALGLAMPDVSGEAVAARAAFRAMASSIDVSTEAGQKQYAGLLALQGAFADLTPIIDTTAEAARQAESILQQRQQLEGQLLQLQGNTAEIRKREMAALLSEENRAIQQAIYALQDKQTADAAAKAAATAAEQVKAAWQSVGDTIVDEINRIRGEVTGSGTAGLASMQAQFAIATGQARAGDQEAAASLPELSRQVLELAKQNASSAIDLKVYQAQIAASLLETTRAIGASQGITVPAFADGGTHAGGWALVGERGPELAYMPPARIYTADQSGGMLGSTARLEALVAQLLEDNRRQAGEILRLQLRNTKAAENTNRLLDDVTEGGVAMRTTDAS